MKELKPPKVPKPTHGYRIAEKAPEIVTAPGAYFPEKKGRVIPLESRQAGGSVTPTRTLQQMLEKLASYGPFPIPGAATQSTAARQRVEGQGENRFETAIGPESKRPPLVSRQDGGEVDPNLFKETFLVNSGDPTQQGIEAAANTASLKSTPINVSPLPSLQSYGPEANLTPTSPSTPLTGMAEYEASGRRMRGLPPETGTSTVNPTNNRLNQITGFLRSFMKPPVFKENRRSPIFGSDQRAAYDKKWKPYTDFMEGTKETPLFSRDRGGSISPDPFEGLSEEERKKLYEGLKTEFPVESLASSHVPANQVANVITPDTQKVEQTVVPKVEPVKQIEGGISGNLSEIKKDILPSGETRYTLPGTEGTATVGPERFFAGGKEVLKGTFGAVSGDELARQRILKEAAPPDLKLPEKTYYEAHPEERFMDLAREENKPLMDTYKKLIEENRARAGGFGLPMNRKAARVIRAEATKVVPELTQGLEKMMALNQAIPEKYFSSETRAGKTGAPQLVQNASGGYDLIYPSGTPGEKPAVSPTGVIGKTTGAVEKSPTELGLIAKAGEKGPDGKPTPEAIVAQRVLDDEKKRKLDIQSGGIPPMGNIPTTFTGKYNEAALEGLDPGVVATIKKLVKYEIPLPSGFALKVPFWQNALGRAAAYDPTWDVMQYPTKFGVRRSFTSGKDKDNLVALNTAVGHINSLVKAKDELANSNWVTGNAAVNLLAKYFPVSQGLVERQGKVTGVKTKFNAVKGEMANIFKRSGATDQEIKSWNDTITDPSTATPASWNAFISGSLELMGSRIEALRSIYERGIGAPKDFAFLSDKSRTILKSLGVDVNAIDPVTGTGEGKPAAENRPRAADFGGNPEGGGTAPNVMTEQAAREALRAKGVIGAEQDDWINQYKNAGKIK
jgi:hypothetical protein